MLPLLLPHGAEDTSRAPFGRPASEGVAYGRLRSGGFLRRGLHICSLLACAALVLCPRPGEASIQCYQCHGTQNPVDYRPLDSSTRSSATGGFRGNHRTHMGGPATPATCSKCHPDSEAKTSSHRTGLISVSSRMNNSPLSTAYRNGTTAWPQTSTPQLDESARCANVNCHFETMTPVWGSPPLATPDGCGTCHGAPPQGETEAYPGGAAGSHPKHDRYYPGAANCNRCHTDHASERAPFSHATSVGNRKVTVEPRGLAGKQQGTYSSASRKDHLPSQARSHKFGACRATYCHSDGTSLATGAIPDNFSPRWGSSGGTCNSCHGFPPAYGNGAPKANTHSRHNFDCPTCHGGTTADGRTISDPSRHANGAYDVSPGAGISFTYVFAANGGTCSDISCHNNGTAVWGATLTCGSCHQVSPGGD